MTFRKKILLFLLLVLVLFLTCTGCIERRMVKASEIQEKPDRTALHRAVAKGDEEEIQLLIDNGADINAKDRIGQTPLHHAVLFNRLNILDLLLKNKADIEIKDNNGNTAKDIAKIMVRMEKEKTSKKAPP